MSQRPPIFLSTGLDSNQGDAGPQGPQGTQGTAGSSIGPQGDRGTAGPQGSDGANGSTPGPQGSVGYVGPDGANGASGAQGPQGTAGAQGSPGAQGHRGNMGSAGAQGSPGPQGEAGPQGGQGAQGPQGNAGTQGPQGRPGTAGPQGFGGASGAQGPQGARGTQGAQGAVGSSVPAGVSGVLRKTTAINSDGGKIQFADGEAAFRAFGPPNDTVYQWQGSNLFAFSAGVKLTYLGASATFLVHMTLSPDMIKNALDTWYCGIAKNGDLIGVEPEFSALPAQVGVMIFEGPNHNENKYPMTCIRRVTLSAGDFIQPVVSTHIGLGSAVVIRDLQISIVPIN